MYENILCEYNITTKFFPTLVGPLLHTSMHISPIAAAHAYILVCVVASNSTSHLFFTSHLFGTRCDLLNYCLPRATCLFKLVCAIIILREFFFGEIY